jgi:hypothetical protein
MSTLDVVALFRAGSHRERWLGPQSWPARDVALT